MSPVHEIQNPVTPAYTPVFLPTWPISKVVHILKRITPLSARSPTRHIQQTTRPVHCGCSEVSEPTSTILAPFMPDVTLVIGEYSSSGGKRRQLHLSIALAITRLCTVYKSTYQRNLRIMCCRFRHEAFVSMHNNSVALGIVCMSNDKDGYKGTMLNLDHAAEEEWRIAFRHPFDETDPLPIPSGSTTGPTRPWLHGTVVLSPTTAEELHGKFAVLRDGTESLVQITLSLETYNTTWRIENGTQQLDRSRYLPRDNLLVTPNPIIGDLVSVRCPNASENFTWKVGMITTVPSLLSASTKYDVEFENSWGTPMSSKLDLHPGACTGDLSLQPAITQWFGVITLKAHCDELRFHRDSFCAQNTRIQMDEDGSRHLCGYLALARQLAINTTPLTRPRRLHTIVKGVVSSELSALQTPLVHAHNKYRWEITRVIAGPERAMTDSQAQAYLIQRTRRIASIDTSESNTGKIAQDQQRGGESYCDFVALTLETRTPVYFLQE